MQKCFLWDLTSLALAMTTALQLQPPEWLCTFVTVLAKVVKVKKKTYS